MFQFKMLENINGHFLSGIMLRCMLGTFQINLNCHLKSLQETDIAKNISEDGIQADAEVPGDEFLNGHDL